MKWTKEQLQAIQYDQDKPLLVSAAAGSGKTAVLIERVYQRAMQGKVDPENILVMTFTEKAALQMRQRIEEKLAAEMKATTDSPTLARLRELRRRFPLAQISTIHAFCLNIVREYGAYLTDQDDQLILQPGFSIISEAHSDIYREQAIDEVLTFIYEKIADLSEASNLEIPDEIPETQSEIELFNISGKPVTEKQWLEDFDRLALILTDALTDQMMRKEIDETWSKLRSMAYFEELVQEALTDYSAHANDFSNHPVIEAALNGLQSLITPAQDGLKWALDCQYLTLVSAGKVKTKETEGLYERLSAELSVLNQIEVILESDLSNQDKWNAVYEQGQTLSEPIILRAAQAGSKSLNAITKAEFLEVYEPNVLPVIALINPNFNLNSAAAKRNQLEKTQPYFILDTYQIEKDMQKMHGPLARFLETVILVDRRMQKIKRSINSLDFNDFEHYALKLLDYPEIARVVNQRYQEIYLDEYQDTNPIQDIIVSRINCPRIFMVGDLKQSIYRFRHADPGLFRRNLALYDLYDLDQINLDSEFNFQSKRLGHLILLNKNFRSAETILTGINHLFRWFMHENIAEVEYDHTQELLAGRSDLSEADFGIKQVAIEHLILPEDFADIDLGIIPELSDLDFESGTDKALALEALQAVKIIKEELIKGRDLSSIAILGRTHKICQVYVKVLRAFNIPVSGGTEKTYLETPELKFLAQLISLLDNMQQDIPLASVMRSEIFGLSFSENDLLTLRLLQPDTDYFYLVVQNISGMKLNEFLDQASLIFGNDLSEQDLINLYKKVLEFVQTVQDLRDQAKWLSISELLDNIFLLADYPDYLADLPFAKQRISDVERFQQWATQFENEQGGGLHNFVSYVNKISDQKLELENFNIPPVPDSNVSVMTIHGAKGLEFPLVILAGANEVLLSQRRYPLFLFNPQFGLTSYISDVEEQVLYSTPAHAWHETQVLNQEWAEEYRLLYVAMTRAEEQLFVISNTKVNDNHNNELDINLQNLYEDINISGFQKLRSYSEIILAFLTIYDKQVLDHFVGNPDLANEDLKKLSYKQETPDSISQSQKLPDVEAISCDKYLFQANYLSNSLLQIKDLDQKISKFEFERKSTADELPPTIDLAAGSGLKEIDRLNQLLPELSQDDPLNRVPAKLTVSEINIAEQNQDPTSVEVALLPQGMSDMGYILREPILESEELVTKVSGKEFGTFIHSFMQFIKLEDFFKSDLTGWEDIFQKQAYEMVAKQQVTAIRPAHMKAAYPMVKKFLNSQLAKRIYMAEEKNRPIYREIPFTLAIPAIGLEETSKIDNSYGDHKTLVQGIIDLWFMEDDQAVLIDYKSDNLTGDDHHILDKLHQRYAAQIKYYALAIEKIIKLPVKECRIWLFRQGKAYEMQV